MVEMPRARRSRGLEELAGEVYDVMKRAGFSADIISYPSGRRTIDVVSGSGSRRVLIRVVEDSSHISRVDAEELRKAAEAYDASPLIVARTINGYEAEDDVVYERQGIHVVGSNVLRQAFVEHENPLIYNIRGHYCVKINPEKLRMRRLSMKMSLGDAARLLGVTRRTVYLYEHGMGHVSIETAERMIEVFGEDIIEPIELDEPLHGEDNTVYYLRRTPVDAVARIRDTVLSIVVGSGGRRRVRAKIEESEKIASIMGSRRIIIDSLAEIQRIIKRYMSRK